MAKTMEEVLERFRTIEFHDDFDMIVAIANGGIVPAGIINQRLQKEVHLLRINLRDEYQHPKYDAPQLLAPVDFNFRGKSILLVDDRIKTGATIKLARELLKEARSIKTFAVNGTADYALFDETCFKFIIRKSKFPQNPKRSVRFSGKGTKRSVQKRKARNTQKAETKVL